MDLRELKRMLYDELDKITKKGELSAGSLDIVDKLTHSIKSIDTIMAMQGYSNDYRSYTHRDSMGGPNSVGSSQKWSRHDNREGTSGCDCGMS